MAHHEILSSTKSKEPRFFYGYIIVLAGFFIMLITTGTLYSFGVFFKPLITEFGWTRVAISGAYSLSMLLFGLLSIVTGRLTDRFGPRVVMTSFALILGTGYLLMSQASAVWQLYLFFGVIVGIGMGGSFVPMVSTVARWFVKRRGLMTGIVVAGAGVGIVVVPPVATRLIDTYGWRTTYIVVGIIILVVLLIAAQFLRRDPSQVGQLPDGEGEVKRQSLVSETTGYSRREAFHSRQFWILGAILFCFGFWLQTIMVHIVPYAIDIGISAVSAASILSITGGISIAGRVIMGGVGDRVSHKLTLAISLILAAVALFWLLGAKELWMLYLFAVIFGLGYSGMSALMSPVVADLFGLSSHGEILGMVFFGTTIGSAIGPVLAGHIFDISGSYDTAFLVSGGVSVIGVILALLLRPTRGEGGTNEARRST